VGTDTANCDEDHGIITSTQSISLNISEIQQDSYSTTYICRFCNDPFNDQGPISFMISGNLISNFLFNQTMPCYADPGCPICVNGVDPCPGIFTGQGIIIDELNLEIDIAGEDCYASFEATLSLFRL